jgi:histidine triad (HIT) family protein
MDDCIFCKIARGEIPARKVYQDDLVVAFYDIHPIRPLHVLVVPKEHVATLYDCGPQHEAALGRMVAVAGRIAREQGASDGFRTIINTGRIGHQEVMHVHMHVLSGPEPLGSMLRRAS